ncbi:protein unc-93 homolog A-like [Diadema antillarum]|uniref:protein unc-93 homolog A-like n=1 Tax=Diadema antillarum TaxID=105358 RepID=UPI003A850B9D
MSYSPRPGDIILDDRVALKEESQNINSDVSESAIANDEHSSLLGCDRTSKFGKSLMTLPKSTNSPPCLQYFSPLRYFKNLLVVSVAFMLIMSAFGALANLQSSLNYSSGLGVASLFALYVALILSSFITPLIVWFLRVKWTLVVCCFFYVLYTAANFYPVVYTLIPAAVLLGIAASPFWAAASTYMTTSAIQQAHVTGDVPETIINRFNGIFFCFFQSAQVWGNLISSLVLHDTSSTAVTMYHCGRDSCGRGINFTIPAGGGVVADKQVSVLLFIYIGIGLLAVATLTLLLDRLPRTSNQDIGDLRSNVCDHLTSTTHLMKSPFLSLLIPIMIYNGAEQAFIGADFTKAFVSCTQGPGMVGYVMIGFGGADALASVVFGQLEKYTGRIAIFIFGGILHLALMIVFEVWNPHTSAMWNLILMSVGWGVGDAALQTQLQSILGVLFPDAQEPAFANYRLWQSLGFAVTYALAIPHIICVSAELYGLMAFLSISLVCYIFEEYALLRSCHH